MSFLDERYLLSNDTAAALFKEVEGLPVVDAHNHSDIKEIAVNANYKNAWLPPSDIALVTFNDKNGNTLEKKILCQKCGHLFALALLRRNK